MSFVNVGANSFLKMSMHCFIIKLRLLGITIKCLDIIYVEIKNERSTLLLQSQTNELVWFLAMKI